MIKYTYEKKTGFIINTLSRTIILYFADLNYLKIWDLILKKKKMSWKYQLAFLEVVKSETKIQAKKGKKNIDLIN